VTKDPPLCDAARFATAVVVVRDPGAPAPLGGYFSQPSAAPVIADQAATIGLSAIGPEAPALRVRIGVLGEVEEDPDDPCKGQQRFFDPTHTLLDGVALDPDPEAPDRWQALHVIDVRDVAADSYMVEAKLTTSDGQEVVFYSDTWLAVYHEAVPPPDPDPDASVGGADTPADVGAGTQDSGPSPEDAGEDDAAGDVPATHPGGGGGGCDGGGAAPTGLALLALGVMLVAGRRRQGDQQQRKPVE
jgi:hypothetical protein